MMYKVLSLILVFNVFGMEGSDEYFAKMKGKKSVATQTEENFSHPIQIFINKTIDEMKYGINKSISVGGILKTTSCTVPTDSFSFGVNIDKYWLKNIHMINYTNNKNHNTALQSIVKKELSIQKTFVNKHDQQFSEIITIKDISKDFIVNSINAPKLIDFITRNHIPNINELTNEGFLNKENNNG